MPPKSATKTLTASRYRRRYRRHRHHGYRHRYRSMNSVALPQRNYYQASSRTTTSMSRPSPIMGSSITSTLALLRLLTESNKVQAGTNASVIPSVCDDYVSVDTTAPSKTPMLSTPVQVSQPTPITRAPYGSR